MTNPTQPETTPTSETQASRERRRLLEKVGAWFDAMVKAQPNINDGDCHTLELTGGFCGYGNDDEPLFDVRVKESIEGSL